jgi:CHAT domain-containing protein/tetratricopeptide (TPR) repeat protein
VRRGITWLASALIFSGTSLSAGVIKVPRDFPTIGAAVAAARDGDLVEIGDGIYVEENIILDKAIRLRAERTHGAEIYSLGENRVPIFVVRAAVEIQGLVIKNCYEGITQRNSPDVAWTGRDLIFQNIENVAVQVNDVFTTVGRAFLHNIIVEGARGAAFDANDAGGIYLRNALITDSGVVFLASNSIFFDVDRVAFSNCDSLLYKDVNKFFSPGTSEIHLGPNILDLDALLRSNHGGGHPPTFSLDRFFGSGDGDRATGGFEAGQGLLLTSLGRLCLERGDYTEAAGYFRRAQDIGRALRYDDLILAACHGLARAEQKLGRRLEALAHYDRAIALVVDQDRRLPLRIYNQGFLRDKFAVFEDAISLVVELQGREPQRRLDRQALVLAEKLKTLGFYDTLLEYRSELRGSSTPELRTKLGEAARKISLLNVRLQEESLSDEDLKASLLELESAERAYKNLMVQMRNWDPQVTRFTGQRPVDFRGIPNDFLGKNEAVLEYLVGRDQVYGILLTEDGILPTALGDSGMIGQLTSDYLKFISLRSDGDFKATKGGAKLGDLLIGPFKSRLSRTIEHLLVIPDGVLHGIPFEALIWESPGIFLAERFAISYAPSISSLVSIRERPRSARRDMDLLVVPDSRPKSFRHPPTWRLLDFPALTFVDEEVKAAVRPFSPEKCLVLEDGKVSEEALKGLPLDRFKIIHIATHGYYDDDKWERSGLLLERPAGSAEDGVLRPTDLYDLHLDSDLVVLSGCQTAKGRAPEGTGLIGLSISFLAAGARAVLASLWKVDDQSTARFMERFYIYLAEKKTIAEALRAARTEMIRSHDRHPFFWAAFVLIGDGQGGLSPTRSRTTGRRSPEND